jgi:hypothetical protein
LEIQGGGGKLPPLLFIKEKNMLDSAIKDMATWEEAEHWLSRHGYGPGSIAEQKELWKPTVVKEEPKTVNKPKVQAVSQPKVAPKPKSSIFDAKK